MDPLLAFLTLGAAASFAVGLYFASTADYPRRRDDEDPTR